MSIRKRRDSSVNVRAEKGLSELDTAVLAWRARLQRLLHRDGVPVQETHVTFQLVANLTSLIQGEELVRELLEEEAPNA